MTTLHLRNFDLTIQRCQFVQFIFIHNKIWSNLSIFFVIIKKFQRYSNENEIEQFLKFIFQFFNPIFY